MLNFRMSVGIDGAHRPTVTALKGMVASCHPLASQAGLRILMAGGNAFDAAIATAAALNVTEPDMSGLGGDAFFLLYIAKTDQVVAVNATGPAPYGTSRQRFQREGMPERGILSASVPGAFDGWGTVLERWGTMSLAQVLEPAMELAEGYPITIRGSRQLALHREFFLRYPTTARVLLKDGQPFLPGEILRQPDLARTFRFLARDGREGFYRGELARRLVAFSEACGGDFTVKDFADYHCEVVAPLSTSYRGFTVYEPPPNCCGHVLLQELNILENFPLASLGQGSPECIHLMVEAKKLAFADREVYTADPRFTKPAPIKGLLSKEYARQRAALIDPCRAASQVLPGNPEVYEGNTTYFCVVDQNRNMVSCTTSIQSAFGSALIAGDTGILLNNRMTYWHLEDHHPNRLEPGKRVRHTISPALLFQNGKPYLAIGTPGADGQVQTILQVLVNIIDFGMSVQAAIEAPRWRSQVAGTESTYPHGLTDELFMEARFPQEVCRALAEKGHRISLLADWGPEVGCIQAIMVHPQSGALMGGADPRRDAMAIGW